MNTIVNIFLKKSDYYRVDEIINKKYITKFIANLITNPNSLSFCKL